MASTTLYAGTSAAIRIDRPNDNFSTDVRVDFDPPYYGNLLVSFLPWPDSLKYKKLTGATLYAYIYSREPWGRYCDATFYASALKEKFDEKTVTYNDAPSIGFASLYSTPAVNTDGGWAGTGIYPDDILDAIINGVSIDPGNHWYISFITSRGSNKPYLVVNYGDNAEFEVWGCAPRSGYLDKSQSKTFSWQLGTDDVTLGEVKQSSAVFRYKNAENGPVTEFEAGTQQSVTLPAGTFEGDTVYWQVAVTAPTGQVCTSEWFSLTTIEVTSTATAMEPSGTIVDGDNPITFRWLHHISTGTAPTGYELQTSTDGESFATLLTGQGSDTSCQAPAEALPSGDIWWRVRTLNSQGVAGQWSDSCRFVVVASPPMPVISVEGNSPRPLITWQATEQQAFEICVGVWESGLKFGTDKAVRCGAYLADGSYTAQARVQNQYGLWSPWGLVGFEVSNAPGEAISLDVTASYKAALSWWTDGEYDAFYVYRDDVPIAKTTAMSYTDNLSSGTVEYQVRGVLDGGNYTLSNSVSVSVNTDTLRIADIATGEWQELRLSETQLRETGVSLSRGVHYMQFAGQRYPSAEISGFWEKTLTFAAAFKERAEAEFFEALIGRLVCVKDRHGEMVIGILEAFQKSGKRFYAAYAATVTQIHYPEEIKYDEDI